MDRKISRRAFLVISAAMGADLLLRANGISLATVTSHKDNNRQEDIIKRARHELKENGITSEQREAHNFLSEWLYEKIPPRATSRIFCDRIYPILHGKDREIDFPAREDAWRMYFGLPRFIIQGKGPPSPYHYQSKKRKGPSHF